MGVEGVCGASGSAGEKVVLGESGRRGKRWYWGQL